MRKLLPTRLSKDFHFKKPPQRVTFFAALSLITVAFSMVTLLNQNKVVVSGPSIDLLKGQDWTHLAGAKVTAQGVQVTSLGRAIVNEGGSYNQTNPPVNVRGPHIETEGDFQINLEAHEIPISGKALFYIYSTPPIIYDEWRYEPPYTEIGMARNELTISVWDGTKDDPVSKASWPISLGQNTNLTINYTKKNFILNINGQEQFKTKSYSLFKNKEVWFGADASLVGQNWILASLKVAPLDGSKIKIAPSVDLKDGSSNNNNSLRTLAQKTTHPVSIGTAISDYALFSDSQYRRLVASEFNLLVPENELKAQFVHPQPDTYSFTEADFLVDFARANNMQVHGHNLVFSEANPIWMRSTQLNKRQEVMVSHITNVVQHYKDSIRSWDVVDEPLADDEVNGKVALRRNIWQEAMGEQYIDAAFRTANNVNPSAKLYLNEYGLEQNGPKWDSFLALVKRLQSRQVPIDGIGFQAHVHEQGDQVDKNVLVQHMQTLAAMGLESRISEADVYGDKSNIQAQQYQLLISACLATENCNSFTTWGVTDKYGSTTDIHSYPLDFGNDLLWDSSLNPKQAYKSIQAVLRGSGP